MTRLVPLSRTVATSLVVSVGGRGDVEVTASAMRLLFALLAREAARVDEWDRFENWEREERLDAFRLTGEVAYDVLWVSPAALRRDLGVEPAALFSDLQRLRAMRVHLLGENPGPGTAPVSGDLRTDKGRKAKNGPARVLVERTLLAAAGGDDIGEAEGAAVWVDLDRMRQMRSRYSPLAYVRMMTWLAAPERLPEAWKGRVTAGGKLALDLPVGAMREALGVDGYPRIADLARFVLEPVATELAAAGLAATWSWVRNRRGEATALRLHLALDESLRPLPRARTSRAARAARTGRAMPAGEQRARRQRPAPTVPNGLTGLAALDAAVRQARTRRGPRPDGSERRPSLPPAPPGRG